MQSNRIVLQPIVLRNITLIVFITALIFGCKQSFKDQIIIKVPQVKKNEKLLVKIYLDRKSCEIKKAYFDCFSDSISKVDSKIFGCEKGLAVINDTVMIQFQPPKQGRFTFHPITLLLKSGNNYIIIDTTFSYEVF